MSRKKIVQIILLYVHLTSNGFPIHIIMGCNISILDDLLAGVLSVAGTINKFQNALFLVHNLWSTIMCSRESFVGLTYALLRMCVNLKAA